MTTKEPRKIDANTRMSRDEWEAYFKYWSYPKWKRNLCDVLGVICMMAVR